MRALATMKRALFGLMAVAVCTSAGAQIEETVATYNRAILAGEGGKLDPPRSLGRMFGESRAAETRVNLLPVAKPPFYAVQLWPRDVGTCGGLVTDEFARVLDACSNPIPGLYACGNATSSVCGPSYPGAGASIGASLTFGFIAADHAARQKAVVTEQPLRAVAS